MNNKQKDLSLRMERCELSASRTCFPELDIVTFNPMTASLAGCLKSVWVIIYIYINWKRVNLNCRLTWE